MYSQECLQWIAVLVTPKPKTAKPQNEYCKVPVEVMNMVKLVLKIMIFTCGNVILVWLLHCCKCTAIHCMCVLIVIHKP